MRTTDAAQVQHGPAPASIKLIVFANQKPRAPVSHAGAMPPTSKPSA